MTTSMEPSLVDRFYDALTSVLEHERPDAFRRPVTVAELYQDIVPYRRMRELIGVELHADYEQALVQLLAHHEAVRLDPPSARDELAGEIDSADPNVSAYRRFAACEVWIERPRSASVATAQPRSGPEPQAPAVEARPEPRQGTLGDVVDHERHAADDVAETETGVPTVFTESGPAPAETEDAATEDAATADAATADAARCVYCDEPLPTHREARYCPYCGGDQRQRPCRACGEPLEPEWSYCVACGCEVAA